MGAPSKGELGFSFLDQAVFDCPFCADPISPFSLTSFESSDSISSRILSNFHRPLSSPLPLTLCERSFRRRLLEFMDMAFNPTNWWTIVYSSSPPNGATTQRRRPAAEARDARRVWRPGCANFALLVTQVRPKILLPVDCFSHCSGWNPNSEPNETAAEGDPRLRCSSVRRVRGK